MKLSVVIPTRGDENMNNIIECLKNQTFEDFEVIFVVDKMLEKKESKFENKWNIKFITNLNSNLCPHNNASELRNYGIQVASSEFINLMDDDERFDDDYIQKSMDYREKFRDIVGRDFVLTPTLMYRKTWKVQNYGFKYFNYRLSRPIPKRLWRREHRWYIQMYSGNSLFAPAYIFQSVRFDEKLDFENEDLEFTYRIYKSWYPIIVLRDLKIHHMERDKNKLENARIWNVDQAYRKNKHRIIFVKKNGNWIQKMKFYLFGYRAQPFWLIGKILIFWKWKERWKIIKWLIRGFRN